MGPRRGGSKIAAVLVLVGVVAQAAPRRHHRATGLHPATVAAHFLVSAGLVASRPTCGSRRHEGEAPPRRSSPELIRRWPASPAAVGAVVLTLGTVVTGSGPHSGDADTPARFGFDPRTISWLHADAVMLFVGLVVAVWLATRLSSAPARRQRGLAGRPARDRWPRG